MKLATVIAAAVFALTAVTAQAEEGNGIDDTPSAAAMAADFLLVRPLGLVATILGTGIFIAQLPLDIFIKDAPAVPSEKLVLDPARFTFTRPLGRMD
ncbi:MAG: hypothetical protein E6Q76_01855 [Rhizobium sp.]|nr:MAG: hypothetical protein E6Q76_01855 [Rhizobium sp.]